MSLVQPRQYILSVYVLVLCKFLLLNHLFPDACDLQESSLSKVVTAAIKKIEPNRPSEGAVEI